MSAVAEPLLEVRGLRTEFVTRGGPVTAVRDVSLTVARGEKTAIVGESGSGKSAFALSLLGLVPAPGRIVAGEVRLGGRDLRTLSERELQHVRGRELSLVYQDPLTALDPVRSIGAQIAEALRWHQPGLGRRAARRRALELLEEVEVPGAARRLDDHPHQYSGGMRQRVTIAIAIANRPDLLIADEPTTALDVTTQAQVLALLERLVAERGMAVILITHNLGLVAGFCDSAHVMYAGRFVEDAPVRELFAAPAHPYTAALLDAVPRRDRRERGRLRAIAGLPPNLAELPGGCAFEPRCPLGNGRELCRSQDPAPRQPALASEQQAACHYAGASA